MHRLSGEHRPPACSSRQLAANRVGDRRAVTSVAFRRILHAARLRSRITRETDWVFIAVCNEARHAVLTS
jgi:hypothetical protein